ncbi:IS4 family transposase [Paenibacillus sp. NRS-1780]|uniref:IS4 family transposase n=3 Tax=unclassified Paenibacillus TaxID=185978 RepID=UPI003D27CA57
MKNSIMFTSILQSILTPEEVQTVAEDTGYEDKARKFTVTRLLQYWCVSALEQWDSYRSGVDFAASSGLPVVHYSRFSTKAAEVPFAIFKELFHRVIHKCSRETRRKLTFPKELLLIDSTTMTVGKTRLPWAPYHGERAGIKLHVALRAESAQPLQVIQTLGSRHDGPVSEALAQPDYIVVMDRAYGKLERLDDFKTHGQSFVIRLRDNVHLEKPHALRRLQKPDSSVIRDITCQLGTPQCRSRQRHRVVMFRDFEGREIRVVTDLMQVTAEHIAQMYKARWQIEVFFRWIKQHLNIPTLFGTTENAVYGQLFCALIVYVLLKWLFDAAQTPWPKHAVLSFARFSRLFLLQNLPVEWLIQIQRVLLQSTSGFIN